MAHRRKISIGLIIGMVCALVGTSVTLIFDVEKTLAAVPAVTSATFSTTGGGDNRILLQFNMPVFANANGTGNLGCDDFTFTDGNSAGLQTYAGATCTHTAGNDWIVLNFASDTSVVEDTADTITPVAGAVFTVGGALPNKAINLTVDVTAPTYTVKYKVGSNRLLLNYNEPVFGGMAGTFTDTPISGAAFSYTDGSNGGASEATAASSYVEVANRRYTIVTLDNNLIADDVTGVANEADKVWQSGFQLFDAFGNGVMMFYTTTLGDANTTADSSAPAISTVEAVSDGARILVNFSEPVFTDTGTSTLDNTTITNDLTYTDTGGSKTLSASPAISHVSGNNWILLTLSGAVTAADLASDTIAAANGANAIYDTFGNIMAATAVTLSDTTAPTITGITKNTTVGANDGQNTVTITYSEDITITGGPAANASVASSATVGDMTTGCTLAGFGAFAAGNMTYKTGRNTVALNAAGNAITITFAGQTGGYRTSTGAQTACSGVFTPTTDVVDLAPAPGPNSISASSTHATITQTTAWNTSDPATVQSPTGTGATTSIALNWTALSSTSPEIGEYKFFYGTTTGAGSNFGLSLLGLPVGTEWGTVQDATLSTRTTATTTITGLTASTTYYIVPYVVNTFGATFAGTEVIATTTAAASTGGGYQDRNPAAVPTGLRGEFRDGHPILTWTDPTDSDLKQIEILKGYPTRGIYFSPTGYNTVLAGAKTFVDAGTTIPGEKLEYAIRSVDTSNNFSEMTSIVTVTVPTTTTVTNVTGTTTPIVVATPDNTFTDVPGTGTRILATVYTNAINQIVKLMLDNNVYKFPTNNKYYPYNKTTALLAIQMALAISGKSCEGGVTAVGCVSAIVNSGILNEDSTLHSYPTRAELYAMLLKAAGIELLEPKQITKALLCKDVTAKSEYAQVIATARKYKIASVYTGNKCSPDKSFFKYEAALYAARASLASRK